jgi:hydroxymethylpyrimidine/phosphomethylpyrimidine kinase
MKTALTIAGSDSSGGAGIQADIKTMTALGVYATSAITALTAQNTLGVADILEVPEDFLGLQLDSVFQDIFPDAVKIGMISSEALIRVVADKLVHYGAKNIVVDPVMVSTSGSRLMADGAALTLHLLAEHAAVLTPNIPEAEALAGIPIRDEKDMLRAGEILCRRYRCPILCKGGHSARNADDVLVTPKGHRWYRGRKIDNPNTHGTGCTLSSAIAAHLALGADLGTAIRLAKDYVTGALEAMLDLGSGSGPLNHIWNLHKEEL